MLYPYLGIESSFPSESIPHILPFALAEFLCIVRKEVCEHF